MGMYFLGHEVSKKISFWSGKHFASPPQLVDIQPTIRCNLKCLQCPMWESPASGEIGTDDWKKIILDIRRHVGPYFVRFYGGEPFCRQDLVELLDYCTQHGIATLITTNATLINDAAANALIRNRTFVQISLDGASPAVHDRLRGMPGTYQKVMAAIERLQGRVPVQLNTTIMEDNLDDLLPLAVFAHKNRLRISYQGLISIGMKDQYCRAEKNRMFPKDPHRTVARISDLIRACQNNPFIIDTQRHLERLCAYYEGKPLVRNDGCETIYHHLVIRRSGDLWLCPFSGPAGNVLEKGFAPLWRSRGVEDKILSMKTCSVRNCGIMRGCYKESYGDIVRKLMRNFLYG